MPAKFVHIPAIGNIYGKWTVKDDAKPFWLVSCECGKVKEVRRDFLLRGLSKSCTSCAQKKHGLEASKVYNTWAAMKQRCLNEKNKFYRNYGGRGITVCDRWMEFESFLDDMGIPEKGLSIDRIDNDGNYCKENCRWGTQKQQVRNRRVTNYVEYQGKKCAVADLAEQFKQTPKRVKERLDAGWSIEKALTTPSQKQRPIEATFNGNPKE